MVAWFLGATLKVLLYATAVTAEDHPVSPRYGHKDSGAVPRMDDSPVLPGLPGHEVAPNTVCGRYAQFALQKGPQNAKGTYATRNLCIKGI